MMREITGRTRIYGILADPIHHVKTPQMMHDLFARKNIDGVLVPYHVSSETLGKVFDGLRAIRNFGGFIATVPHKSAMLDLCDAVTDQARLVGAVNCVRREDDGSMAGAQLDGIGFVEGLRGNGITVEGMSVHLAGAGGAAKAIAFALAEAGVASITIANRTEEAAQELAGRVSGTYSGVSAKASREGARNADMVVNATPLGMEPDDPEPVDFEELHGDQIVADAIMEPEMTPLLKAAQDRGCTIQPGAPMLRSQIELMAQHMGAL